MATPEEIAQQERLAKQLSVALQELEDAYGDLDQNIENHAATLNGVNAKTRAQKEALLDALKAQRRYAKATGATSDELAAFARGIDKAAASLKSLSGYASSFSGQIRGMMGITTSWKDNWAATLAVGVQEAGGLSKAMKKMQDDFNKTGNRANVLGSTVLKVTEMLSGAFASVVNRTMALVNALDGAQVSFSRLTGGAPQYRDAIVSLERDFYKFGLTAEDAANVMGSLYSSVSGFTAMSSRTQKAVRESTALLVTLGIDAEDAARNIEFLNRSLGMTGGQAAQVNQQLFSAAQQLGISTNKMISDFAQMGPQFAVFGNQAVSTFVRIEAAAKQTGVAMERILSITAKFDRFDTAAESVGNLNAILGGPYLSVMKMVQQTDPTQRMAMLSSAVREAGRSFEQLGYFERKALAEGMGLESVNELALVMRGRFDLVAGATQKSSFEIEQLAEQTRDFNTIQSELQQTMRIIAIQVGPLLIRALKGVAQYIQQNASLIQMAVPIVVGLKTAMIGLQMASYATAAGLGALAAGLGGLSIIAGIGAYFVTSRSQVMGFANAVDNLGESLDALPSSKTVELRKTYAAAQAPLSAGSTAFGVNRTPSAMAQMAGLQASRAPIIVNTRSTLEVDGAAMASAVARHTA